MTIPVLLAATSFEEASAFKLFDKSPGFYLMILLSMSAGITLTFSQNLCTVVNSPIATSLTGNVKDILLTTVSLLAFNDVKPNFWLILGLSLSLLGALVYSYPKFQEKTGKKTN
jgi:solute carrier family 35